jgi:hypothetical protein
MTPATRRIIGISAVVAVILAGGTFSPRVRGSADATSITALVRVSVLPIDRDEVLADQTVIVEGDRIATLGPTGSVAIPADARRIDAYGRYLMPGLIDMHVHIRERELAAYVANGITSVRNMWGYVELPDIMRRIESGAVVGPTIYSASPGFDAPPPYWPQT